MKKNRFGRLIEARRNIRVSRDYLLSIGCICVDLTRTDFRQAFGLSGNSEENRQSYTAEINSASSCEVLIKCPTAIRVGEVGSAKNLDPKDRNIFRTKEDEKLELDCAYTSPPQGHHQAIEDGTDKCKMTQR